MRQYSTRPRNIICGAATFMAAMLCACGAHANATDFSGVTWYNRAVQESQDQRALPPVEITATELTGNRLTARFAVRPGTHGHSLNIMLAVPEGDITTATVTADAFNSSGAGGQQPIFTRETTATVEAVGYIRGHRLARVTIPAAMAAAPERLLQSGSLTIVFRDAPVIYAPGALKSALPDPLADMVARLVANPQNLREFEIPLEKVPAPHRKANDPPVGGYRDAVARFTVDHAGITGFTGADLQACGLDISQLKAREISVWSNGKVQPLNPAFIANPDGPVLPTDIFMFVAPENESPYSATTEYWVRAVADEDSLMKNTGKATTPTATAVVPHFMASNTVEQDMPPVLTKNDQFLNILDYRWVWWTWTSATSASLPMARPYTEAGEVTFDLDSLSTTAQATAQVEVTLYGHHWPPGISPVSFDVNLNARPLGRMHVEGDGAVTRSFAVSPQLLRETSNTLRVMPIADGRTALPDVCFDRAVIRFPRQYVMTSPTLEFIVLEDAGATVELLLPEGATGQASVMDVTGEYPALVNAAETRDAARRTLVVPATPGGRYQVAFASAIKPVKLRPAAPTPDLRSAENKADVIVISWPDFLPDMETWAEQKRALGHDVKLVNVMDIYDQFGYGNSSPHALRAFLRHAAVHWQAGGKGPAASVVLLVGDSTSAYRNEFRNDVINYVPTMRIKGTGDTFASDQWFVSLFGDDPFADALIGRFSVNNREDLRHILRKQTTYATAAPGPWQNTLGFIADHTEFDPSVQRIMRRVIPPRFFMKSVRMDKLRWMDNYYFPREVANARQAKVSQEATGQVRDMFNEGAAVVTYFGHGSPNIWSNERIWFGGDSPNSDNLMLTNADRLPIVINMTCNSGAIDYPQPRWNICISEDFMRVPNGGAVACFVPSGPGLTVQHERLMTHIADLLLGRDPMPLGECLQLALWRFLAENNPPDLARMYILLGDPLLHPAIALPAPPESLAAMEQSARLLPPESSGAIQVVNYTDDVLPGAISTFTTGTSTLPDSPATTASSLAVSIHTTSGTQSHIVPGSAMAVLRLERWTQPPIIGGRTCRVQFQLRNPSPLPTANLRLVITNPAGEPVTDSQPFNMVPFMDETVEVELNCPPGLTPLRVFVQDATGTRMELDSDVPLATVGLRPDGQRDEYPPAAIDPRTVTVRYMQTEDIGIATVTAQVYVIATEPLSNLRVGLKDPTGAVIKETEINVPPTGPGQSSRLSLSTRLPAATASAPYRLRLDPAGFYPELQRYPGPAVNLGSSHFADVEIVDVQPDAASPTDGETVFFDVTLRNTSATPADNIRVSGAVLTPDAPPRPMESRVNLPMEPVNLPPLGQTTLRLRWDPFNNAGETRLLFQAQSLGGAPDVNPANNTKELTLRARTKADIRSVSVGILRPTQEDLAARRIRIQARVRNDGETAAHGLKVNFYAQPQFTPENFLGETTLDEVPPGEERQTTLTYTLKPGEEDRPFVVGCEVMFRGSLQRVPIHSRPTR